MKRGILPLSAITFLCAILLVACANNQSNGPAGSTTVQISLTDFHITSSIQKFTAGKPYHFIVTNNGHTPHEFMIMSSATEMNRSMSQMDKMALAHINDIAPGATKTLNYTFPVSTQYTQPQFACHYPGHYEANMYLNIKVS